MSTSGIIGKFLAVAITIVMLVLSQPRLVSAFELVYEIRANNGTELLGDPLQRLVGTLDADNSVRVGVKVRPGLWIGYSSRDGLSMVLDF
jgi:hypothetical protein